MAAAAAAVALVAAGCGGSSSEPAPPHGQTLSPAATPGAGWAPYGGPEETPRLVRTDCSRREPIAAGRVTADPAARRLGPVVFTPLARSRSLTLQPEDVRGARGARSVKVGATVIGGRTGVRVRISAPGGARLLYDPEQLLALAGRSLRWRDLPAVVVLEPCREAGGAAAPTAFPGGFVLRRAHPCVRLEVTGDGGRTVSGTFPFGRGRCAR